MSTTKKKTTTADKVEQHAVAASEARTVALQAVEQLTASYVELDEAKASALAGDESLTPEKLAMAHAAVELAGLRATGAEKRSAAAHADAPFRPILAESVATALQDILDIRASAVKAVPTDGEVPHLYVVQKRPASIAMWGRGFAGQVSVTYKCTKIHRELTRDDYADALHRRGVTVTDATSNGEGATLSVALHPALPYVADVPDTIGNRVADDLAGYLRGGYGRGGTVESVDISGDTRVATLDVSIETDEFFGRFSDLLHKATAAGRVVAVDKLTSGYRQDPVTLPNGDFGITPEYYKVGVRLTLRSTTTRYEHVLAGPDYEPVLQPGMVHAA